MRIISGTLKGRVVQAPANLPVRPTTDFARTGLFNILSSRVDFDDITFLDLFCGTGIISFEMCSRGCKDVIAVDNNRNCIQFIQSTISSWKIQGMRVIKEDVFKFLNHSKYQSDIIFADPPYAIPEMKKLPGLIIKNQLVKPGGVFILEHGKEHSFEETPHFEEVRNYGNVNFSIFQF